MTAQQPERTHRQPPPAENPEPPIPYVLPQNTRGQQTERLTPESEQEIRERNADYRARYTGGHAQYGTGFIGDIEQLLAELDAVRAELIAHKTNEAFALRAHRAEHDLTAANERVRALETALRLVSSHWVEALIRGWEEPLSADGRETVWDAIDPTLKDRLRKALLAQGDAREAGQ